MVTTVHSLIAQDGKATRIVDARTLLIRMQTVVSARVERDLLRASVAVAVVNPFIASAVRGIVGRSVPVRVLPNGVDETIFSPDQTTQRALQALAVGRLVHGKGFDDLLRAWPKVLVRHPTASLVIVGDGPLRLRLERMARLSRISHSVTFVGAVGRSDLVERYRRAGVLVQPSHHEGMSTVLLEAMACATPVVATDVGAHSLLVKEHESGRLVAPGQPDQLAEAINDQLGNPSGADTLAEGGRTSILRSFTAQGMARAYVSLYEEALRNGSSLAS